MRVVTTQDIVRTTGLTLRQVDHWVRTGYLKPLDREGAGTGVRREYSMDEFKIAIRMADLVGCGFTPLAAHKLATGDMELLWKVQSQLSVLRVAHGVTHSSNGDTV